MAVFYCMEMAKDQTISLSFGCTGVTVAEHTAIGMAVTVESVVDTEGDLNLQEDIDPMERTISDMEVEKAADT